MSCYWNFAHSTRSDFSEDPRLIPTIDCNHTGFKKADILQQQMRDHAFIDCRESTWNIYNQSYYHYQFYNGGSRSPYSAGSPWDTYQANDEICYRELTNNWYGDHTKYKSNNYYERPRFLTGVKTSTQNYKVCNRKLQQKENYENNALPVNEKNSFMHRKVTRRWQNNPYKKYLPESEYNHSFDTRGNCEYSNRRYDTKVEKKPKNQFNRNLPYRNHKPNEERKFRKEITGESVRHSTIKHNSEKDSIVPPKTSISEDFETFDLNHNTASQYKTDIEREVNLHRSVSSKKPIGSPTFKETPNSETKYVKRIECTDTEPPSIIEDVPPAESESCSSIKEIPAKIDRKGDNGYESSDTVDFDDDYMQTKSEFSSLLLTSECLNCSLSDFIPDEVIPFTTDSQIEKSFKYLSVKEEPVIEVPVRNIKHEMSCDSFIKEDLQLFTNEEEEEFMHLKKSTDTIHSPRSNCGMNELPNVVHMDYVNDCCPNGHALNALDSSIDLSTLKLRVYCPLCKLTIIMSLK